MFTGTTPCVNYYLSKKKANTVWPKTVPIKTQLKKSQTSGKRPNTGNFLQM